MSGALGVKFSSEAGAERCRARMASMTRGWTASTKQQREMNNTDNDVGEDVCKHQKPRQRWLACASFESMSGEWWPVSG